MKTKTIFPLLMIISLLVLTTCKSRQSLPPSTITKIDKIFAAWDKSNSPGCAVGIVRNDSLIFAKGYGMANLEYSIPNSPSTIYHMASISKQFTAFSIVLLARQGKLKLDDEISKYLSWFPNLNEKITIRNLLNHTSGIRDQWQLLAISGTRLDDVITQDQIVKILGKQQSLNFKPGEKHSYSNSGFTMLAEIVKSASGKSLRQYTDSFVFKPLGMSSTHFHDNYTEIEKNRSYSYERIDSAHYSNAILNYSNAGATSLFTNVTDMSKWIMNFYNHKLGDQKDIDQLTEKGKLNNGTEIDYALGIVSSKYKGWRQFVHGGADAGYRTFVTIFPDLKMGFIVFSNLGDFDTGGKAYQMADLFISDTTKPVKSPATVKVDSTAAILKDISAVKHVPGDYLSAEGLPLYIEIKNSRLVYHIFSESNSLLYLSKDTFSIIPDPRIKVVITSHPNDTTLEIITPDEKIHMTKYKKDTLPSDNTLHEFTGTFYCPELDCKYGIILKDHHLYLTNSKYNDTRLTLAGKNDLLNDFWWMNHLLILRNNSKQVTGFEVNSGRIMHLRFDKLK
jgi:CubicO group peptidase (beta-lactamase class C family)